MLGSYGGYNLLTDQVIGIKNVDLAIVYTFVISIYLLATNRMRLPNTIYIKFFYVFLLGFVGCILCSLIHYNFTPYQILQGGRSFLLVFSLPIILQIRPIEMQKMFEWLLWITVITSILYILQIVFGRPLMPYPYDIKIDGSTGLIRLYNSPALLTFFFLLSFMAPKYFPVNARWFQAIFLIALLCTLGRTRIITSLLTLGLAMILNRQSGRLLKAIVFIGLLIIPFMGTLTARFEKGNTGSDIQYVMKKGVDVDYTSGTSGTLTYRIAWVVERAQYLAHRPLVEQLFGLGLISDSQRIVHRMYRFRLGLYNEENRDIGQLTTPDISYGNILSRLGYLGGATYLLFILSLTYYCFRQRHLNTFIAICAASLIMNFVLSMSGSALSEPKTFAFYFLALAFCHQYKGHIISKRYRSKYFLKPKRVIEL